MIHTIILQPGDEVVVLGSTDWREDTTIARVEWHVKEARKASGLDYTTIITELNEDNGTKLINEWSD